MKMMESFFRTVIRFRWPVITLVLGSTVLAALPIQTLRDLVAQYLLLYSFSGDPDNFDDVVDYDYQHANVAVYLRSDTTQDVERVVGIVRDFAVREFGQNGAVEAAAHDPLGVRFGRWLAGIEPTVTGWETNSGFRIGIAGNGDVLNRLSELVISGQLSSLVTSLGAVFLLTAFMLQSQPGDSAACAGGRASLHDRGSTSQDG